MVGKVEGARGKIRGRKTTFVVGLGHIGGLALGVMERGGEGRGGEGRGRLLRMDEGLGELRSLLFERRFCFLCIYPLSTA